MILFNILKKIKAYSRLHKAMEMADNAHASEGGRYYVVPTSTDKLMVLDRHSFRNLKQKGYVPKKYNIKTLETECFYCTPYRNGKGGLSKEQIKERRMNYYSHLGL